MEELDTNLNIFNSKFINSITNSELAKIRDEKLLEEFQKPTVIRAAIYLRVSTKKQAEKDKASLPEQEKQTKEFIDKNDWILAGIYKDEGKSGTKIEGRDDYLRLMEDARLKKFEVIVVWDFDRFSRNTGQMIMDRDKLRKYGVQMTSVNCPIEIESPKNLSLEMGFDKEIITTIQAILAKEDNRKRVKRMSLGKINNARKGIIPCRVPYGYRKYVKYENGNRESKVQKIILNKKHASIVKEIYELFDNKNYGMRKIAYTLNVRGETAPLGGKWQYTTVRYVLTNYTYTGLVRWGWYLSKTKQRRFQLTNCGDKGIIEKGSHPIIISEEQFKRVQTKLNKKHMMGGRAASSTGLLVGIAKCGRCGGGTYVTKWPHWFAYQHPKEDRSKYKDVYGYMCSNYSKFGKAGCTTRYLMSKDKLEKNVINKIAVLAESKGAQEAFVRKMKQNNKNQLLKEMDSINTALIDINKKSLRQKLAYDSGITSLNEYKEDITKNETEKMELGLRMESKRLEIEQETKIENQSRQSLLALINFKKIWNVSDFISKKNLLHSILEKVIVNNNKIEISFISNNI